MRSALCNLGRCNRGAHAPVQHAAHRETPHPQNECECVRADIYTFLSCVSIPSKAGTHTDGVVSCSNACMQGAAGLFGGCLRSNISCYSFHLEPLPSPPTLIKYAIQQAACTLQDDARLKRWSYMCGNTTCAGCGLRTAAHQVPHGFAVAKIINER